MKHSELVARADQMAAYLRRVNAQDPGTRAMLRRGLGRRPENIANFHAHAVVTRYLPERPPSGVERAFYTVAALIAAQPRGARDQEVGKERPGPAEDRKEEPTDTGSAENERNEDTAEPDSRKERRNLGQTLAWAVENGDLKGDMVRDRLHLLARYRTDRLHRELPKLITHLRADLVPIDWGYLLRDLGRWDHERDQVGKEWVQQYHRTRDQLQRARKHAAEATTHDTNQSETE